MPAMPRRGRLRIGPLEIAVRFHGQTPSSILELVGFLPLHEFSLSEAYAPLRLRAGADPAPFRLLLRAMSEAGRAGVARWYDGPDEPMLLLPSGDGLLVFRRGLAASPEPAPATAPLVAARRLIHAFDAAPAQLQPSLLAELAVSLRDGRTSKKPPAPSVRRRRSETRRDRG